MPTNENLSIRVNYYDEEEKTKFESSRSRAEIDKVTGTTILISKAEFLTYLLFPIYKNGTSQDTYKEIKSKVSFWIGGIEELLDFSHGTINWKRPYPEMTSRVGVAVGLCVANAIHGTTEADWCRIPEIVGRNHAKKTLDYQLEIPDASCSTGEYLVHMEAKGSAQSDATKKTSSVSQHKQGILQKKIAQRQEESRDVYYGTISVLDQEDTTQCYLVDPPSPERLLDPRRHKLLARLYFFWSQMSLISPNSTLTTVLRNRIRDLSAIENFENLDQLFLVNRYGVKTSMYPTFFSSRPGIRSINVVGRLFPLPDDKLLFVGTVPEIYDLVINQNFNHILSYKSVSHTASHRLTCVVRRSERELYSHIRRSPVARMIERPQRPSRESDTTIIEFDMRGSFHFSSSGRVFGVLPLRESYIEHRINTGLF